MRGCLLVSLIALILLPACDSTPGPNPFEECLVVFTVEPVQIQLVQGDSVTFTARRYNFCDQQSTSVDWRMQDTLVAGFRPISDSTAIIRALAAGSTVLTVIDRADSLHRAGVTVIVTP